MSSPSLSPSLSRIKIKKGRMQAVSMKEANGTMKTCSCEPTLTGPCPFLLTKNAFAPLLAIVYLDFLLLTYWTPLAHSFCWPVPLYKGHVQYLQTKVSTSHLASWWLSPPKQMESAFPISDHGLDTPSCARSKKLGVRSTGLERTS